MKTGLDNRLNDLEKRYLSILPEKLSGITQLWHRLTLNKWDSNEFQRFHALIHTVSSLAENFGHGEIGRTARALDALCEKIATSALPPDGEQREDINAGLNNLNRQLAKFDESETNDTSNIHALPLANTYGSRNMRNIQVYVLDDDKLHRNLIETLLLSRGYQVQTFFNNTQLEIAMVNNVPDIVIMDLSLYDVSVNSADAARRIAERYKDTAIMFTSTRTDLSARLEAVRLGGQGFFTKPVDIDGMALRIQDMVERRTQTKSHVLVIDDDASMLEYTSIVLGEADFDVTTLQHPDEILEVVNQQHIDLFLIDLHMPDINGVELSKIIRQCDDYISTPVVFLSSEDDPGLQNEAILSGADHFIQKPVNPEQLVNVINSKIGRMRPVTSQVEFLKHNEPVTGLLGRQHFYHKLDKAIHQSQAEMTGYALMMIDIDNYSVLSQQVGADNWDLYISAISAIIKEKLSSENVIAHISENLIGILIESDAQQDVIQKANNVCEAVADANVIVMGMHLSATCSIGITMIDKYSINVSRVLYETEIACESVRQNNGNGVKLYMDTVSVDEQYNQEEYDTAYERLMRHSLNKQISDYGFYTVFQPIVNLRDSNEEKYDVFLRLKDNDGKEILPSRFIPIAEKYGFIKDIDYWVAQHTLTTIHASQKDAPQRTFFIKIMGDTICDDKFIDWYEILLKESDVTPASIVFQITEATATTHLSDVMSFATRIKALGCGFAIEHFGTLLSSDRLLEELPLDYVKMDDAFIHNLGEHKENRSTLTRISQMALQRNILPIASYVEDADSLAVIWSCGINHMQGYFLQSPEKSLNYDFSMAME